MHPLRHWFHCHSFQSKSPGRCIEIPCISKLSGTMLHRKNVRAFDVIRKAQYHSLIYSLLRSKKHSYSTYLQGGGVAHGVKHELGKRWAIL